MSNIRLKISGDRLGAREVTLQCPGRYVIGRDDKCDVVLSDHMVSKRHCQIDVRPSGARIRDLQSTNGTQVDGQWIGARAADQSLDNITPVMSSQFSPAGTVVRHTDDEVALEHGAEVEIGSATIRVIYDVLPGDTDMIEKHLDDARRKITEAGRIVQLVLDIAPDNNRAVQFKRLIQTMEYTL